MTTTVIESSGLQRQGQALELRETHQETPEVKVRYFVHLDCSYPRMQSRAYAEAWSPRDLRWNRIAFLTSGEWTLASYAIPGGDGHEQTDVLDAVELLRGQVRGLLT